MRRMATANVLIIGLNGLGCEIGELGVILGEVGIYDLRMIFI